MKRSVIILISFIFLLYSCEKDKKSDNKKNEYTFINQNLKGKIAGKDWEFVAGMAKESKFTKDRYSIDLFPVKPDDKWLNNFSNDKVIFEVKKNIGLYDLNFDWNNEENSFTVTFFDIEEIMNYIANVGGVQILKITESYISGRMDVKYDENNYVNGYFTAILSK